MQSCLDIICILTFSCSLHRYTQSLWYFSGASRALHVRISQRKSKFQLFSHASSLLLQVAGGLALSDSYNDAHVDEAEPRSSHKHFLGILLFF